MLSGSTGAGKTIMALQFLYEGAVQYNEPGLYITTQNDVDDIRNYARNLGFEIDDLEKKGLLTLESINPNYPQIILKIVEPLVKKKKFARLVIDSATIIEYYIKDVFKVKNVFYKLFNVLRKSPSASIIVSEMGFAEGNVTLSVAGIEFLADTVIALHRKQKKGAEFTRGIEIVKMRQSEHTKMIHPYTISAKGVEIFPDEKWF
jgi:circadian clock protein KaiC